MIGQSPAIEALRSNIRRLADTDLVVLVRGENGTGKELVAQAIHSLSRRRDQPFVTVSCAEKFELAAGGTLYLDEIGDLQPDGQAALLRLLDERVILPSGGAGPSPADARILAATSQDLAEMARREQFRQDLYFHLNVVTLDLPPLRERGGDILLLAGHFLGCFCRRARRKTPKLSPAAQERLLAHCWPGNVRELRNMMERLAYLSPSERIEAEDLACLWPRGETLPAAELDRSLADATARFQTDYIRRTIEQSAGNMSRAADRLGLHRSNLYRKMRQLEMEPADG